MKCANCQTENPDTAKFCMSCGTSLVLRCSNCQTTLPPSAKFCLNCGQPVANPTAPKDDARLTRLTAATPALLAEKMRSARLAGERKVVTALFADVVGSTTLAEQMDAEDWTAIMNRAFDRISPAIYKYEGTVARLMGDALLAFFGAPVAHEDDPIRATHASLDIIAAVKEYAEEVRHKHGIDFAMRVGLNTGPVVVGEVGSDLKYEFTAMGDAVNLAARMQSAARPMTVLISENTHRFIAPVFETNDLGLIEVKGKAEPVRVYEVNTPKVAPGRLRGVAGLESPMVGRGAELQSLIKATTAMTATTGHLAVLIGEPGLGKTRLISEWKAACPVAAQWVEARCLSYGQGLAYHLLIDLLHALVGVPSAAEENETCAALQRLTTDLFAEAASEVYPYLGHLLSLELEGAALDKVKALDPQALQNQYLSALRRLLIQMATRQPLVLILDDTHWADPSSTDLLLKLLPLVAEAGIFFAFVTRPDQESPGWRLVAQARESFSAQLTELQLNPLSTEDSRQLVSNLLEVEALPDKIRAVILQRAEGNPFFVEEVIRMLIDRGAIVKQNDRWAAGKEIENVEIPDNLQGLLLARIDRLPEEVKRTLRVASVIGRQFSVNVLAQVLEKTN